MGCHSSKQAQQELSPTPLPWSKSLPGNDHVVSLTSSTLGSLNLDALEEKKQSNGDGENRGGLSFELAKARAWSEMLDCKTPQNAHCKSTQRPRAYWRIGAHGRNPWQLRPLDPRSFSFYPCGHFYLVVPKSNLGPIIEPDLVSDSSSCNGDMCVRKKMK